MIVDLQAQGLNQLSTNEREQVFYEIHGVADAIPEDDPTFVTSKLIEFDLEIDKLLKIDHVSAASAGSAAAYKQAASGSASGSDADASAYKQAASSLPEYVQKTEFRLLFLRGDAFDVGAAASRMISYFQHKLELFGSEKLTKDITLQDYDNEDLKCLKTGSLQTLPIRDRSGRAVLCHVPCLLGNNPSSFTVQNRLRALWYVYHSMIEDIEVQRQGYVWVNYGVGFLGGFHNEMTLKLPKIMKALPVRGMGIHICYSSNRWQLETHRAMMAGGGRLCTHIRVHFGTHKEVQSKLKSFGIPCDEDEFIIGPDGEVRRHTQFLKLVETWQKRDEKKKTTTLMVKADNTTTTPTIIVPRPNDVLLGRNKLAQEHSGNVHFRCIVNKFQNDYDSIKGRLGKTAISSKIVSMIKEEPNNGRFLKMEENDSGCWVEVDDKTACRKVAHIFRNQRSKLSSSQQQEEQQKRQQQQQQQQPLKVVKVRASESVAEEEDGSSIKNTSKKLRRI